MAEFSNPNLQGQGSGGSGDSRGLMALTLLAVLIFLGFQFYAKPKQPPAPPAASPAASVENQPKPSAPLAGAQAVSTGKPQSSVSAVSAAPVITAPMVTATTVENGFLKVVLSNQGAQAEHWFLLGKQYKDHPDPGGQPLDLVNAKTTAFGLPLSLFTYEPELTKELNSALYQVSVTGAASPSGVLTAPCTVTFHYARNGIDAVKSFSFDSSYVMTAEVEVKRNGVPVRALLAWPSGLGDQNDSIQFASGKFAWSLDGKDDTIDARKLSGNATLEAPYDFAAINDLYFAAAFLPDDPGHTTVVVLHNAIDLTPNTSDSASQKKPADVIGLAVGDTSGTTRLRLFAGPKEIDLLKTIHATSPDGNLGGKSTGPSLEPLIQFGWITVIAKPLYYALRFLHDRMGNASGNWGWAIIIVTTFFTLIMLPLRFMAMKSSLKMMRIQPKVDAIKARYKNLKATDPKRAEMNNEVMELYKVEGFNMYGSCLPMLPQIPLFWAYFRVLQNAVELRQAQWFWLTDLSSPDPKYILPVLIIISMFLVQILTPSPGMDPGQRRMMAFMMPIMFGFFLLHYASGLALYWATSNLISLAMQIGVNQSHVGKEMHAIAAKRAAKTGGGTPGSIQKRR